jgi:hypothetical protein
MAVNIKATKRFAIDTATDSMSLSRSWSGWDENASDQCNWDHNRGRNTFGDRVDDERYATLAHEGRIRHVAELTGRRQESNPRGARKEWSLEGRVLVPGAQCGRRSCVCRRRRAGNHFLHRGPRRCGRAEALPADKQPKKWGLDPDLLVEWSEVTANRHPVEGRWWTGTPDTRSLPGPSLPRRSTVDGRAGHT